MCLDLKRNNRIGAKKMGMINSTVEFEVDAE